ncbi:MAG: diguanylate cyclase [Pseudomonadota bacterium]
MTNIHPGLARALLEQFPAGVALADTEDRIVWVNDAFAEMIDLPAVDIIGVAIQHLPLPRLASNSSADVGGDGEAQIAVKDRLVVIAQPFQTKQQHGKILMLVNRGHALVSFLNALSAGNVTAASDNGMLTNTALRHRLEIEISRSRRYMNPLSCIVIRFNERIKDRSVSLNDVQREIASMLKSQLRWVDVLGEWDSSSLVVILPETTEIAATILSTKLEMVIEAQWSLEKAYLPIHWGISSWRKGDDINRLVRRADNRHSKNLDAK